VAFLLVITELFSQGAMAETLRTNINSKSAFLKGVGQCGPKFQVEGMSPNNHYSCRKTRCIDLSYGIRMLAELSFVLSQFMHLTDRQMDRRLYDRQDRVAYNAARLKRCMHSQRKRSVLP